MFQFQGLWGVKFGKEFGCRGTEIGVEWNQRFDNCVCHGHRLLVALRHCDIFTNTLCACA